MPYEFVERHFDSQCAAYLGFDIESERFSQDEINTGLLQLVAVQDAMIHLMSERLGIDTDILTEAAKRLVVGEDVVLRDAVASQAVVEDDIAL